MIRDVTCLNLCVSSSLINVAQNMTSGTEHTNGMHATGPLAAPSGRPAQEIWDNAGTVEELSTSLPDLHVEPLWRVRPSMSPFLD